MSFRITRVFSHSDVFEETVTIDHAIHRAKALTSPKNLDRETATVMVRDGAGPTAPLRVLAEDGKAWWLVKCPHCKGKGIVSAPMAGGHLGATCSCSHCMGTGAAKDEAA